MPHAEHRGAAGAVEIAVSRSIEQVAASAAHDSRQFCYSESAGAVFHCVTSPGNMRIYLMEPPDSAPDPLPFVNGERALGIIATATLLALLYFARDVLVPITLAVILSLLMAPLVRVLRRIGLGQTLSVLAAVLVFAFSFAAVAGVIGSQVVHMAQSLPRYEQTIERKLKTLNDLTVGKFNELTGQAGRFTNRHAATDQPAVEQPGTSEPPLT